MRTIDIFCANEQQITPHSGSIEQNGEFVFICACGRFVKFPSDTTPEQFKAYIEAHETTNKGQISVEAQNKMLDLLMGSTEELQLPEGDGTPPVEVTPQA